MDSLGSIQSDSVTMSTEHIPNGDAGTDATLNRMVSLISKGKINKDVIYQARQIAMQAPERDQLGQIDAIHNWIKQHIYYINDPDKYEAIETLNGIIIKNKKGLELLADPVWMLHEIQSKGQVSGDCDEFTILEGSLLGAIGFPVYVQAIGLQGHGDSYNHVYMYTYTSDGQRIPLDGILKDKQTGWEVPPEYVKKNSLNQ